MRTTTKVLLCGGLMATTALVFAQPGRPGGNDLVTRLMAFDANKDGKLTKEEVTDARLFRLFNQIDADKKGVVTKEQLEAFAAKNEQPGAGGKGGKGGAGGKGGFPGGPGGGGFPGGPGGGGFPGGPGGGGFGPPMIGQLLPPFLTDELKLTGDQKKKLEELQKDTDAKLDKLLTDDQRKQLKEMKERGPGRGGFPGGGGRGGRGGPGGGPGGPGGRGPGGGDRE